MLHLLWWSFSLSLFWMCPCVSVSSEDYTLTLPTRMIPSPAVVPEARETKEMCHCGRFKYRQDICADGSRHGYILSVLRVFQCMYFGHCSMHQSSLSSCRSCVTLSCHLQGEVRKCEDLPSTLPVCEHQLDGKNLVLYDTSGEHGTPLVFRYCLCVLFSPPRFVFKSKSMCFRPLGL